MLTLAFFFLLFLFLLPLARVVSPASGLPAFPTSEVGGVCQAQPSAALAQLSARLKSSAASCMSYVASFSIIISSLTTWWNATTIEALEMRGMLLRT
jgi:hypothetical protein